MTGTVAVVRKRSATRWLMLAGAVVLVAVALGISVRSRSRPSGATVALTTEPASRRDLSQTVDATGTVQAVEVIEIKSKASGQIMRMPVSVGSVVHAGDLLVQIDPLTVRNQHEQALAAKRAADASVQVSGAQKTRSDELFTRGAITEVDRDGAVLTAANALASQARAAADLQIARQALDDATVRAPSNGTVLEQTATPGMVITSATSSASGGTTLLRMADLNRLEMRALVGETDVGGLEPGMSATVTVDAFPERTFQGHVIKIEPQAVIQQSVTMFPVRIAIDNENGRLLPGMNGEVTIEIASRKNALTVPLEAIRTARELPTVAAVLGLDADTLAARVERQVEARAAARAARPDSSARIAGRVRGVEAAAAANTGRRPGQPSTSAPRHTRDGGAGTTRVTRAQLVMVQTPAGPEPRLVRIGISDFDRAEVLSGLEEGEPVVLLAVAEQAAKRKAQQTQFAQRVGNGLPGSAGAGRAPGGGGAH